MPVTLTDLTTAAEADSDRDGDTSVTSFWVVWANQAIEALWRVLVANYKQLYYTSLDITLAGGAGASSVNVNHRRVMGVDVWPDTNRRMRVPPRPFAERNEGSDGWPWAGLTVPWARDREYLLIGQGNTAGQRIDIVPYERAAGNYRFHLRRAPFLLTAGADTIDPVMEPYREFLSVFMARKALAREESSTEDVTARLAELQQEIVSEGDASEDGAMRIADTEVFG